MTFTYFACNITAGMHAQLAADTDRAWLEYERQQDLEHEEQLARDAVEDDETDQWPWYADSPIEIVESEIVEDAGMAGLAVSEDSGEVSDWDGVPVDVVEDEYLG